MRRAAAEAHAQELVIAGGEQGVHRHGDLALPLAARGDHHGRALLESPTLAERVDLLAGAAAPAVAVDLEVEAGGSFEVGFESNLVAAMLESGEKPAEGQFAGQQFDVHGGALETAAGEAQRDAQARGRDPADAEDVAMAAEGAFDPFHDARGAAPVRATEPEIPGAHQGSRQQQANGARPDHA